jgi:hypothetical protein
MLSLQANAAKDAISTQHARRVFLMLRIASGVLMAMGLVWAITFTLRGDWYIVGIDVLMLIVGALVWVLAGRSQIRLAFYVMFVTIFVVVTTISLLQDIPNLAAPRTTHHFLLVLAVSVLLFMRDERALLRHGMALLCMVVYIALGSAQFGLVTA